MFQQAVRSAPPGSQAKAAPANAQRRSTSCWAGEAGGSLGDDRDIGDASPEASFESVEVSRFSPDRRVQFALEVGLPDDSFEREADRIAEQIVAGPTPKRVGFHDGERIQRKAAPGAQTLPANGSDLGAGRPLDRATRVFFERRFGFDFSTVRIHADARAAESARSLNALAYTAGRNVVFRDGVFAPETASGKRLLAHELTHVVQQSRGSGSRIQRQAADPFVVSLQAKLDATPRDLPGFYGTLGGLNGARAGDAAIRTGLDHFLTTGKLSSAEAFRAVALQEIGPERLWPLPVRNFAEGLDSGTFTTAGLAPAGADNLRAFCVEQAGAAAEGTADPLVVYRNRFDSRWDGAAYAALPTDFENALDSKGPRNQRARRIFNDLYASFLTRAAYDSDVPHGFRAFCDTHEAPDGINNIASQRLQRLRALLNPPVLVAAGTADPAYVALVAAITPAAQALDARDHQEIDRSHTWRLAVENKVKGTAPAATQPLRDDLWSVITTAHAVGPPPAAGPPAVAGPPAAPEPVPPVNALQQSWLASVHITPPPSPQNAQTAVTPVPFQVRSGVPNPGLAVRRRVVVEPAAQVTDGQQDEKDWPNAATVVDHTPKVNPDAGAAGTTVFTARLTMPPLPVATFAEQQAAVTVADKRLDWFKATIDPGVTCMDENSKVFVAAGSTHHYFGGQFPITVTPQLGAPGAATTANPQLTIFMDGTIKRGGTVVATMPRSRFGASAASSPLFSTILRKPVPPPAAAGDPMTVEVNYYTGAAPAAIKTQTLAFNLAGDLPVAAGGDAALMAADNSQLNQPITTPGSLLFHMANATPVGSPSRAVAAAVAAGTIHIAATIVRSDSASKVTANGDDPKKNVAYAMGKVDGPGVFTHTLIAAPGAIGWRWSDIPDTVFLNLTPNSHVPGTKRANAEMTGLLTHEGIHAADRIGPTTFDRYATEFRAYWIMGMGAADSTAPDPAMSNLGPQSPRANHIFRHLYGNATYPWVQPNYDSNIDHFRERVDNLLHPDGINLTLSHALADLRAEIESYVSSAAHYPVKKAAVLAKYAACGPDDRREITNNRAWRDLVEEKFHTTLIVTPGPPPVNEQVEMKNILAIPQ